MSSQFYWVGGNNWATLPGTPEREAEERVWYQRLCAECIEAFCRAVCKP